MTISDKPVLDREEAAEILEAAMARLAEAEPTIPGIVMALHSPRLGLDWQGATGSVTMQGTEPLQASDAFRIASVTKVYLSATALRAIEEGKFGLFDRLRPLVSPETAALLERGGYDIDRITVEQLLTHTSGIHDFATDEAWPKAIAADPKRAWTRAEQIAFAIDHGRKLAEPGTEYHYSDTGYIIAGEIIERSTGLSLPEAASQLIDYARLGLTHTYFEKLQPTPAGERRAHQYVGAIDMTEADPSFDLYGGGGIVSTVGDLVRFIRPLLLGEIFKDPTTLPGALLLPAIRSEGGALHSTLLGTATLGARQAWAHGGYWGVLLAYCPDLDLAVAISVGQSQLGPPGSPHGMTGHVIAAAVGAAIDAIARR